MRRERGREERVDAEERADEAGEASTSAAPRDEGHAPETREARESKGCHEGNFITPAFARRTGASHFFTERFILVSRLPEVSPTERDDPTAISLTFSTIPLRFRALRDPQPWVAGAEGTSRITRAASNLHPA